MADYSRDFQIAYDSARESCAIKFRCFDTPNSIIVFGKDCQSGRFEEALLQVRDMCLELHRLWSFSLPGSDVSRINEPVERIRVDMRTALLIASMKSFNSVEPAFDFTVGPVSYLWKHATSIPGEEELARALEHVGADKVSIEGDVVVKADPHVQVDVGGAAKGFAADSIALLLRSAGVESADIDLGGNLFMLGNHPDSRPWRVAVRIPEGVSAAPVAVEVCDKSVVTSGSYERFVELEGKRYQHIVDARTGMPSQSNIVSATVVSPSSLQADMLATTTLLVGSKEFSALKNRHPEVGFIAITDEGAILR